MPPRKETTPEEKRIVEAPLYTLTEDEKKIRATVLTRFRGRKHEVKKKAGRRSNPIDPPTVQRAENAAVAAVDDIVNSQVKPLKKVVNEAKEKSKQIDKNAAKINRLTEQLGNVAVNTSRLLQKNTTQFVAPSSVNSQTGDAVEDVANLLPQNLLHNSSLEKPLSTDATDSEIEYWMQNRLTQKGKIVQGSTPKTDMSIFRSFRKQFPEIKNRFYDFVLKETNDKIIPFIQTLKKSNAEGHVRVIYNILHDTEGRDEKLYQYYRDLFYKKKDIKQDFYDDRIIDQTFRVPTVDAFNKKINEIYPKFDSVEKLFVNLITLNPLRDVYQNMILTYRDPELLNNPDKNYMYIHNDNVNPQNSYARPVVFDFKTKAQYGKLVGQKITGTLYIQLNDYIIRRNYKEGDKLFPDINKVVKETLINIGIGLNTMLDEENPKSKKVDPNNFFRHMVISDAKAKGFSSEEMSDMARRMGHTREVQKKYIRVVDPDYFENTLVPTIGVKRSVKNNNSRNTTRNVTNNSNPINVSEDIRVEQQKTGGSKTTKRKLNNAIRQQQLEQQRKEEEEKKQQSVSARAARALKRQGGRGITLNI